MSKKHKKRKSLEQILKEHNSKVAELKKSIKNNYMICKEFVEIYHNKNIMGEIDLFCYIKLENDTPLYDLYEVKSGYACDSRIKKHYIELAEYLGLENYRIFVYDKKGLRVLYIKLQKKKNEE